MNQQSRSRTTFRIKIVVLFLFVCGVVLQSQFVRREISGQVARPLASGLAETPDSVPADILIDDFDKTIQDRFLHAPQFGIYRIMPRRPVNPHLEQFSPNTDAEKSAVNAFKVNSWDVGIYLFGRKVTKREDTKREKYDIKYRMFKPIPVTSGIEVKDLPAPEELASEIKQAFVDFTKRDGPNRDEARFDNGRWSYVLRPVRAVNQSCLQCHKDYVITDRLGDGNFVARPRRIGDPNGILVYAFKRSNE